MVCATNRNSCRSLPMRLDFHRFHTNIFFVIKFMVNNKDNLRLESSVGKSDAVKSSIHVDQVQNFHNFRNLCTMHTYKFPVFCNVDS